MNQAGTLPPPRGGSVLTVQDVTKRFPGNTALRGVSFDLRPGEVHVLFGENGAGKSTLVNIVAGALAPDAGEVRIAGEPVRRFSPEEAHRLGVNAVFQDFSLVPMLSVSENLFLGREPGRAGLLDRREADRRSRAALEAIGVDLPLGARVGTLPRAQQQLVEIAKALLGEPRVLILDEPTTALTEPEVDRLFGLVAQLTARGIGIIYITHRTPEIWRIGDRVTVLRDGARTATRDVSAVDEAELIQLMTGRTVETLFPRARRDPGRMLLELDGVGGHGLEDVSLEVCAGEVVGLAGLVGSGKAEIGRMCFGLARPSAGRIAIAGEDVARRASPRARLERGVVYYPADRREEGIVPMRSIRENVALQARGERDLARRGVLRRAAERTRAAEVVERLRIHPAQPEARVASLSGGNQQKVVLARALMTDATVHIFDEPTAGVDVGARVEVYDFIRELCEGGSAVLLISSDLPEVVHLAHRVYVVHAGRIRAHLEGDRITEESVLGNFFDGGSQP